MEPNLTPKPLLDPGLETMIIKPGSPFPGAEPREHSPFLELAKGKADPDRLYLGREAVLIGRAKNNGLVLQDDKVSRSHARISFEAGSYLIEDLNSTNGTAVDGQVIQKMLLRPGMRITLGETELIFQQPEPEISLKEKLDFLGRSDLFNWLDQETKTLLARKLVLRFFPKETVVQGQQALLESMYFIYAGELRIAEVNEEGAERIIDVLKRGDYFGERALLAGESGSYSLIAQTDVQLLELRKENLNELLQINPELNRTFYQMVFKKLRTAQKALDQEEKRKDTLKDLLTSTEVAILGENRLIQEARKKIEQSAKAGRPVLILGPSGTGKKAFARYYHNQSASPDYPYAEISLADLDSEAIEGAIFGVEQDPAASHMKGQVGYLELIEQGTLAIAHTEKLNLHQQSKLATYLKLGWFHRQYGQTSVKSRTKVLLLATGTEAEVFGQFIPELQEQLKDHLVPLPALTQRLKDIPILAEYFLKKYTHKEGKGIGQLSREAQEKLVTYTWPGNVKELKNVIKRAVIIAQEDVIIPGDLIFVLPSEKEVHKLNILRNDKIRKVLSHPLTMKVFLWVNIAVVLVMAGFTLYTGFLPDDDPLQQYENNLGMVVTWLVWFPILPISAFLIGRIWCGVCPIAGIGDLVAKIKRFNLPVPKLLKRLDFWLVIFSFLVLDYLEEFLDIAGTPYATGLLLVSIIGLSALFCVLFERKAFCRYVCPLAGFLGTYSLASPVEVRGNKKICQTQCGQHLCYKGTEKAEGCPMFSYPAALSQNAECMMCLNCLRNCEQRGVQINLRPPLQELWRVHQPVLSLSLFGVMLVGLLAHHQFMEGTYWKVMKKTLVYPEMFVYTLLYIASLVLVVLAFSVTATLSAAASQEKVSDNMARFGLAFIPLALAGHLAHVGHEVLDEGIYEMIAYLSMVTDYFLSDIPIGSQVPEIEPFIHGSINTLIKVTIILLGFLGSLVSLVMIARKKAPERVFARLLPHLLLLVGFFIVYSYIFTAPTGKPKPPAAEPTAFHQTRPQAASIRSAYLS